MPGPLGYPDWQRQSNYDGPVLYHDSALAIPASVTTSIFDVSRFAYLAGWDKTQTTPLRLLVQWFSDSSGVTQTGSRNLTLSHQIAQQAQYRMPNLGPFVQLSWTALGGLTAIHTSTIFPTNRFHPLELIPTLLTMETAVAVNVNAGGTYTQYPTGYYAGPVRVWGNFPAGAWNLTIRSIDNAGNPQFVDRMSSTAAGDVVMTSVVPATAWLMEVNNTTGAAGSFYATITATATGAA